MQNWHINGSVGTSFRAFTYNVFYYPGFGNFYTKLEKGRNGEVDIYYDDGRSDFSMVYYYNELSTMLVTDNP